MDDYRHVPSDPHYYLMSKFYRFLFFLKKKILLSVFSNLLLFCDLVSSKCIVQRTGLSGGNPHEPDVQSGDNI